MLLGTLRMQILEGLDYLFFESVVEVVLGEDLVPVPVHLLTQMRVLTLL